MENNKNKKIVLIGAGAVGTSFIYSAINWGLVETYGIIDVNGEVAKGQAMDLEDATPTIHNIAQKVKFGGYELVKNADILVITAGRPQKEGETRLQMVEDNARIMASIADQVKANGFKGITVIAANPVDVMTAVYQERTGFDYKKVISSSCSLDSSRLRVELSKVFNAPINEVEAFVMGEHGDSSLSVYSNVKISGKHITEEDYLKVGLNNDKKEEMHKFVYKKAYEIITRKRATHYGIGANLAEICKAILNNEHKLFTVGTLLHGEYNENGVYIGVPCLVGSNGVEKVLTWNLTQQEKEKFHNSAKVLKEYTQKAIQATK